MSTVKTISGLTLRESEHVEASYVIHQTGQAWRGIVSNEKAVELRFKGNPSTAVELLSLEAAEELAFEILLAVRNAKQHKI